MIIVGIFYAFEEENILRQRKSETLMIFIIRIRYSGTCMSYIVYNYVQVYLTACFCLNAKKLLTCIEGY